MRSCLQEQVVYECELIALEHTLRPGSRWMRHAVIHRGESGDGGSALETRRLNGQEVRACE